jgi:hypothetical protein
MVLGVPLIHRGEDLVGLVDHQVGADRDLDQIAVGQDRRHLDDPLLGGLESRHLHIEPDQHVRGHPRTLHRSNPHRHAPGTCQAGATHH